jgi:hypothetical protein
VRARLSSLQVKKLVGASAAILFVAAAFGFAYFDNTFVNYPRSPDSELGRSVPYAVKGIVVYITQGQRQLLTWLDWIAIVSGMVMAVVLLVHRGDPFSKK